LRLAQVFDDLRRPSGAEPEVVLDLVVLEAAAELAAVRGEEPLEEREVTGRDGLIDRLHVQFAEHGVLAGFSEDLWLEVSEEFQRVDGLVLAAEVQRV
jgi:hypothetical protein